MIYNELLLENLNKDIDAVTSGLTIEIEHLLKWEFCPDKNTQSDSWLGSIKTGYERFYRRVNKTTVLNEFLKKNKILKASNNAVDKIVADFENTHISKDMLPNLPPNNFTVQNLMNWDWIIRFLNYYKLFKGEKVLIDKKCNIDREIYFYEIE